MAKNIKSVKKLIHYDKKGDVLYLGAQKGVEEEFIEIAPGIMVELSRKGKVIGVEVLNASRILKLVREPIQRQNPRVAMQ